MLELTLTNGKSILIGGEHIVALISGGAGAGSTAVLSNGMTYEVRELPHDIQAMMK